MYYSINNRGVQIQSLKGGPGGVVLLPTIHNPHLVVLQTEPKNGQLHYIVVIYFGEEKKKKETSK